MLVINDLKTALINALKNKENYTDAQFALANAISNYLTSNMIVKGTYSAGVIPGTPPVPDPLNGSVVEFKIMTLFIKPPVLMSSANSGGFDAWAIALSSEINLGVFKPVGLLGGSPTITTLGNFSCIGINTGLTKMQGKNFEECMGDLASKLINGIKGSQLGLKVLPATSINGGTGIVTLSGGCI